MAPKAAAAAAGASAAKQWRSRKRRKQQEHNWSSSDDSSSDEDERTPAQPQAGPSTQRMDVDGESKTESDSESSEASSSEPSDSSDSDDSSDDNDDEEQSSVAPVQANGTDKATTVRPPRPRAPTLSPSPPPRDLPSFLSDPKIVGKEKRQAEEEDRRARFRKVYMDKLVQGFGSDLEKLRETETNLDAHVLQILIDALGSGTDVYNDAKATGQGIDEVGVLLGDKQ